MASGRAHSDPVTCIRGRGKGLLAKTEAALAIPTLSGGSGGWHRALGSSLLTSSSLGETRDRAGVAQLGSEAPESFCPDREPPGSVMVKSPLRLPAPLPLLSPPFPLLSTLGSGSNNAHLSRPALYAWVLAPQEGNSHRTDAVISAKKLGSAGHPA